MNTLISYLYRDSNNYKRAAAVVVAGYNAQTIKAIEDALDEGCYFLAEEVGLENLRDMWSSHYDDADHIWHEWTGAEPVSRPADAELTLEQLADRFVLAGAAGWPVHRALAALEDFGKTTPVGQ